MKTLRSQAGCFSVRCNGLRPCLVSLIPLRVEIDTHQVPPILALCQFKHYIVKKENSTNCKIATEKKIIKNIICQKKKKNKWRKGFYFACFFAGTHQLLAALIKY